MKNWEIWATQTHCKSKKWKISWTKGQLSLRWLMLIFPPPWKKGPPKALPLINPNDLWQTIPKNVFFSAFIKNIGAGYFKWEFFQLSRPNIKSWQIRFYKLSQVTKSGLRCIIRIDVRKIFRLHQWLCCNDTEVCVCLINQRVLSMAVVLLSVHVFEN